MGEDPERMGVGCYAAAGTACPVVASRCASRGDIRYAIVSMMVEKITCGALRAMFESTGLCISAPSIR